MICCLCLAVKTILCGPELPVGVVRGRVAKCVL